MLTTYRLILAKPGAMAFASAGLLSRLPISMFNIGLILMVQIQYDSYEMAGRVAAVGVLAWAAQTMPTARMVDKYGQRAVMGPLVAIHTVGVVIVIVGAMTHQAEPLLWVGAILASLSGPLGSLTRARWAKIASSRKELESAFALEGALDEVLFIGGPALAAILATTVYPPAALIVSTFGVVVGCWFLLAQRETEPAPRKSTDLTALGWNVPRAVVAVALAMAALGAMFGAIDISVVAFAEEQGAKPFAGVALGVFALGSLLGGLIYGAIQWKVSLHRRFIYGAILVAIGVMSFQFVPTLTLLSAVMFVSGFAVAPTLTNADTIIHRVVLNSQLTEGMAWTRMGIGIGVAAGAWLGGHAVDSIGSHAGFLVAAISAAGVAVVALATWPWLRYGTAAVDDLIDTPVVT